MSIETICQTCASKLRVADELAGKRARCPQCGSVYVVPAAPESFARGVAETVYQPRANQDEDLRQEQDLWQLRTPDGQVYGPVSKRELDQWAVEGRVPPEAAVQNASSSVWRSATELYPQLSRVRPALEPATNPFTDQPEGPAVPRAMPAGSRRPHRGLLILVFGILGFVLCPFLAPVAWIMGRSDLRDMRSGVMDDGGMAITQAGTILGMIVTILSLLWIALRLAGGLG